MPKLKADGIEVEVPVGATVLIAFRIAHPMAEAAE